MSNHLAIATVTACLGQILKASVPADLDGTTISTRRPDNPASPEEAARINVYLYSVVPNAVWRNSDLPARSSGATLLQRPQAALDLHYLITFYGNETRLEPQRLLARAVCRLHARPLLPRQRIRALVQAAQDPSDAFHFLRTSNLAEQIDLVRFSPLALSLEELSKLWSVLLQTSYSLSVAYLASVVLIEEDEEPAAPALPVRERRVHVLTFEEPVITEVTPQIVTAGATLTIHGQNLKRRHTRILLGTQEVPPATITDRQITLVVPGDLLAGARTVQVVHDLDFGTPFEPHRGFESNLAAFMVAPKIISPLPATAARGGTLMLSFSPEVGRAQRAAFLIGDRTLSVPERAPDAMNPTTASLSVQIPADFEPGTYLLRVRVEGAVSPLIVDEDSNSPTYLRYIGPLVEIT